MILQEVLEKQSQKELIEIIRELENKEKYWSNQYFELKRFISKLTVEDIYIPKHLSRYYYINDNKIYDRKFYGDCLNYSNLINDKLFKTKKQAEQYLKDINQISMFDL